MRRLCPPLVATVVFISLVLPAGVSARELCSVSADPVFEEGSLKLECLSGTEISGYLEESICGGADRTISVIGNTGPEDEDAGRYPLGSESYIAQTNGLPGREAAPLGDVLSGMGKREEEGGRWEDGFSYPDSAEGMSTTCVPGKAQETQDVFHCIDGNPDGTNGCLGLRSSEELGYPYFEDPVCRWRLKEGSPSISPQPYQPQNFQEYEDGQTPELCGSMCEYLNQWQYFDCLESVSTGDEGGVSFCNRWGNRYICNDQEVLSDGACGSQNFGDYDFPNASMCDGENCRCSGPENWCPRTPVPPDDVGIPDMPYRSYYRKYSASYERKEMADTYVPDDVAKEDNIPVACYGFYDEFDARYERTSRGDLRCVIDLNVEDREKTQSGKGTLRSDEIKTDPPEAATFDEKTDSWWTMFAAGFSLLSPHQKDLSQALSDVNDGKTKAISQTATPDENLGLAPGGYIRDFDDTGPLRTIVRWWHKQETAMNTILTPPALRLIHIPAWAMGFDAKDPLFRKQSSEQNQSSDGFSGPRERPVDLQIHAREDQIGEILAYIDRTIFSVQEVPLPIVIPVGSPTEFRARAQALCSWYLMENPGSTDCKQGTVGETITRFEEYATHIEQTRQLRSQLAETAGKLLSSQQKFLKPLHEWSSKNLKTYEEYLLDRTKISFLRGQWAQVQTQFRTFHEETNVPWCRNDRFTTAIYALLDPWMTTRHDRGNAYEHTHPAADDNVFGGNTGDIFPENKGSDADTGGEEIYAKVGGDGIVANPEDAADLPSLASLQLLPKADIIIDLSVFKGLQAPLKLPVLKVTQVQLSLDQYLPPVSGGTYTKEPPPKLPSLDPVLEIIRDIKDELPAFCPPETEEDIPSSESASAASTASDGGDDDDCPDAFFPPQVKAPELWSDEEQQQVSDTLLEISEVILGMSDTYKKFWDGLNPDGNDDLEDKKDALKCPDWDSLPCVYTEVELIQEVTRMAARPGILLKEDFESAGVPRGASTACLPDDSSCLLLNPEHQQPKAGWEVGASSSSTSSKNTQSSNGIDDLRKKLRDASLPRPVGELDPKTFPPYTFTPTDLLRIYDVPESIPLSPASSSSSARTTP